MAFLDIKGSQTHETIQKWFQKGFKPTASSVAAGPVSASIPRSRRGAARNGPKPNEDPWRANAHPVRVERRLGERGRVGEGGRRTLAEPWAYPRPGDATFAAPEPANQVSGMRA